VLPTFEGAGHPGDHCAGAYASSSSMARHRRVRSLWGRYERARGRRKSSPSPHCGERGGANRRGLGRVEGLEPRPSAAGTLPGRWPGSPPSPAGWWGEGPGSVPSHHGHPFSCSWGRQAPARGRRFGGQAQRPAGRGSRRFRTRTRSFSSTLCSRSIRASDGPGPAGAVLLRGSRNAMPGCRDAGFQRRQPTSTRLRHPGPQDGSPAELDSVRRVRRGLVADHPAGRRKEAGREIGVGDHLPAVANDGENARSLRHHAQRLMLSVSWRIEPGWAAGARPPRFLTQGQGLGAGA